MPDTGPAASPQEPLPTRRNVLRGAAAAGVVGVATTIVSACGGSDQAGAGGTPKASAAPSGAGSPSGGGGGGGGASGAGTTLGASSKVPVGGGQVFAKQKVVVTQPDKGKFLGFSAVCTHQGCTVATVEGGTINCPCHGSKFDIATGKPVAGPAPAPLPSTDITVSGGEITLA